ncbi:MAG: hypothetical protein H0V27_08225 [Pyrinomonadaceae bacterium]|nr:hypothetical protein [Pyrinomonadaceae bacterium]
MSDYLWNKTGAPDEEIEALEESLRPLRYRHQDLELPARAEIGRHRRAVLHRSLAAAAILLFVALAGIWVHLLRTNAHRDQPQASSNLAPPEARGRREPKPDAPQTTLAQRDAPAAAPNSSPSLSRRRQSVSAPRASQQTRRESFSLRAKNDNKIRRQTLAANVAQRLRLQETREGELAKDRLMFALNITSHKLNVAQRKIKATTTQSPAANDENR